MAIECCVANETTVDIVLFGRSSFEADNATKIDGYPDPAISDPADGSGGTEEYGSPASPVAQD